MKRYISLIVAAFLVMAALCGTLIQGADDKDGVEFFEKNIRPVLADQCYGCHRARTLVSSYEAGFRADSLEGLLKGGDSMQPAIIPGNIEKSPLIERIRYGYTGKEAKKNMPPKWGKDREWGGKLPDATIKHFERWIKMGAPVSEDFKKAKVLQ